ncbi:MAG: hypothetical protein K5678_05760 [Acetatifactor sp.]|nr:hypothetical protein [Acetatifactor sp.]
MAVKANAQKRRAPKKKGFPFFWIFYLLFVIAMVIFWIRAVDYTKACLVRYEESQPVNHMDKIVNDLRKAGVENYVKIDGEVSRFETQAAFERAAKELVEGKILSYKLSRGVQDPAAPKYDLLADGEQIGYLTLKETSSETFFLNLLTISEWALDKVEVKTIKGYNAVDVTVPDTCEVRINGILADERERLAETETLSEFAFASEYVAVPSFVSYHAEGLLEAPTVEITDTNGNPVDVEVATHGTKTTAVLKEFAESEMPEDLKALALENTERYTNYFSVDLTGAKASTKPIRDMFPENSYYLELAETYRREDMWMYSDHDAPVFKNEIVNHYVRYNDDLFSCEVSFDKEMKLTKTRQTKVDHTHFRIYYGRLNGEWKIVDMVTLLENE